MLLHRHNAGLFHSELYSFGPFCFRVFVFLGFLFTLCINFNSNSNDFIFHEEVHLCSGQMRQIQQSHTSSTVIVWLQLYAGYGVSHHTSDNVQLKCKIYQCLTHNPTLILRGGQSFLQVSIQHHRH